MLSLCQEPTLDESDALAVSAGENMGRFRSRRVHINKGILNEYGAHNAVQQRLESVPETTPKNAVHEVGNCCYRGRCWEGGLTRKTRRHRLMTRLLMIHTQKNHEQKVKATCEQYDVTQKKKTRIDEDPVRFDGVKSGLDNMDVARAV